MLYNCIVIILSGIIEGFTEWLPVRSTGHMLIFDKFMPMKMSESFKETYFILVQLAAVIAVIVIKRKQIMPICKVGGKISARGEVVSMWLKVCVACLPGVVLVMLAGDTIDTYLNTPFVISVALIFYGVVFIFLERLSNTYTVKMTDISQLTYKKAFLIGLFQALSAVPGTSRSGATVTGGMCVGADRNTSSEFAFFMAIPVMAGMSVLKLIKIRFCFSAQEISALLLGMAVSFVVSLFAVKFLTGFVKKHTFLPFGIYRILLGITVLITA